MVSIPVATGGAPDIGPKTFGLYEGIADAGGAGGGGGGTGEAVAPEVAVVVVVAVAVAVGGRGERRHSGCGGPGGLKYISGNQPSCSQRPSMRVKKRQKGVLTVVSRAEREREKEEGQRSYLQVRWKKNPSSAGIIT